MTLPALGSRGFHSDKSSFIFNKLKHQYQYTGTRQDLILGELYVIALLHC